MTLKNSFTETLLTLCIPSCRRA